MKQEFTKMYQLWTYVDHGWLFEEFDTLEEVITAQKYSDWYVTRRVNLKIDEIVMV